MISAKILADSINQQGDRLTSLVLTYPRIIHAEMMTHRMFSRNASSSRAVPVDKMIKAVRENTFCPFEFQKSHKGMQGSEYFTGAEKQECVNLWLESAELALQQAEKMKAKGISKQIINRILEPYQYYTILITGSKEGWDNFFKLRLPIYQFTENGTIFKSKKDVLKLGDNTHMKDGKIIVRKDMSDLEWLSYNKGQAEIHMMALAEAIYDAVNESTPKQLKAGEWHIPFEDKLPELKVGYTDDGLDYKEKCTLEDKIVMSVAMAARTSYTVVGHEKELNAHALINLHDRLLSQDPPHSSPLEHVAQVPNQYEYDMALKEEEKGWFYNLKGFKSYRYIIEYQK